MKKTNERNLIKGQKAITLIALVITIIVLLILAGVSIAILTGENGILAKATKAKEDMEYGRAYEEVKLAVTAVEIEYKADDKPFSNTEECAGDLDEELKRTSKADDAAVTIEEGILIATNRGYKFPINEFLSESTIVVVDGTGLWEQENGVLVAYKGEISELDGGTLVIPNYVDGVKVTEIGERLFHEKIKQPLQVNLKISEGITKVNNNAFSACNGLVGELKLPQSLSIIGTAAFANCSAFTGQLIIPASVTTIGESAFENCTGFTGDLTIPASVTSIGEKVFNNCTGFEGKLIIGIEEVPEKFFTQYIGGTQFTELQLEEGVNKVGTSAFEGYTSLDIVRIPSTLEIMEEKALRIEKYGETKLFYVDRDPYQVENWSDDWVYYTWDKRKYDYDVGCSYWLDRDGYRHGVHYWYAVYYSPNDATSSLDWVKQDWESQKPTVAVIWTKTSKDRKWFQPYYGNNRFFK